MADGGRVKVLIVDDEPPARRRLRSLLASEAGVAVTEAADGLEAVEALRTDRPDLVLLDVQMPGMSGFDVIEAVGVDAMPPVVFVTAYDEHALRAFDVNAVDYVLKPVTEERFRKALARARERTARADDRLAAVLGQVGKEADRLTRLVVRKGERLRLLPVGEIVYLSACGNYVDVHTGDDTFVLRDTLARLERRLDPGRFARIHRSEIVNLDWVLELSPWFHGDYEVILKDGRRLRLSRRYQDRLLPA